MEKATGGGMDSQFLNIGGSPRMTASDACILGHCQTTPWGGVRHPTQLAHQALETEVFLATILVLITVDITCTTVTLVAPPSTFMFEICARVAFGTLVFFFVEQILHLIAFGRAFFDHKWWVAATPQRYY